ncbi:hypothetical protein LA080_001802 [Diaporthe eres]|nr:hypothetical protein LA080_001802 [Diaporthe eres]
MKRKFYDDLCDDYLSDWYTDTDSTTSSSSFWSDEESETRYIKNKFIALEENKSLYILLRLVMQNQTLSRLLVQVEAHPTMHLCFGTLAPHETITGHKPAIASGK